MTRSHQARLAAVAARKMADDRCICAMGSARRRPGDAPRIGAGKARQIAVEIPDQPHRFFWASGLEPDQNIAFS